MLLALVVALQVQVAADLYQILDYLQPLALLGCGGALVADLHTAVPEYELLDLLLPLAGVDFTEEGVVPGLLNVRQCEVWQYLGKF